jgi:lambda family phage tail tape measure protein
MARNEARHAVVLDAEMDILKRKFGDMEGMLRKLVGKEYKIDVGLNMPMMDAQVAEYKNNQKKIEQYQNEVLQKRAVHYAKLEQIETNYINDMKDKRAFYGGGGGESLFAGVRVASSQDAIKQYQNQVLETRAKYWSDIERQEKKSQETLAAMRKMYISDEIKAEDSRKARLIAEKNKTDQLNAAAADKARRLGVTQNVQLAAQIQDFGIQVAGGQNPLLAAVQQGSQLSSIYGGFGNALKALASTLTPVNIGIAALVGSVGALSMSYVKGQKDTDDFAKAILKSGNAAGLTEGYYRELVAAMGDVSAFSNSANKELLLAFAGVGQLTAKEITQVSEAALRYQMITGATAEQSSKMFSDMKKDPGEWAKQNNRAFNLVDFDTQKHIQMLSERGRKEEAFSILAAAVNKRFVEDTKGQFSVMSDGLEQMAKKWSNFWSSVFGGGKRETTEDKLNKINEALSNPRLGDDARGDLLIQQTALLTKLGDEAKIAGDRQRAATKLAADEDADSIKKKLSGANDSLNAALAELAATKQALPLQLEITELKRQEAMLADEALKDNLRYVIADKERLLQMREIAKLQKELASVKGGDSEEKNLAAAAKRAAIEKQIIDAQVKLANMPTGGNLIDASINKSNKSVIDEGKKRLEALLAAQLKYNEDALKLSVDLQAETAKIKASELTDTTSRARAELEIEAEKKREIIAKAKEGSDEKIKAQKAFEDWYMASQARITDEFKKRTDAQIGMSEALQKYYEELQNKGKIAGDATVKILQSIEDTMLNVVKNGKLDFKSLVDTILTEFYRLQIVKPLMASLMGEGGKGGILGGLIQNVVTPSGGGGSSNVIGDIITLLSKDFGFASGGYTGYGNTNQPAGIVHKGEYVMPKSAVNRIGLGNLENMKNGGSSSPVIHISIDSSTDRAYVQQLVASGVQRGLSVYHGQVQRGLA